MQKLVIDPFEDRRQGDRGCSRSRKRENEKQLLLPGQAMTIQSVSLSVVLQIQTL